AAGGARPGAGRGGARARLAAMLRETRYAPATQVLTVDAVRARAFESNLRHYAGVFGDGQAAYAIPRGVLTDPVRQHALAAFFFWTAWSATALRPGREASYTSNWPYEPLIGNGPTRDSLVWTGVSVLGLLGGIGAFVWYYAGQLDEHVPGSVPATDPLLGWRLTPSQRATHKYFAVVAALFLLQILTGAVTAHYAVEGDGLYGIPLSRWLPYTVTRTW